jgi:hypothetical protein
LRSLKCVTRPKGGPLISEYNKIRGREEQLAYVQSRRDSFELSTMASMASPSTHYFYKNHKKACNNSTLPRVILSQKQPDQPTDQVGRSRRYSLSLSYAHRARFGLLKHCILKGNRPKEQRISCNWSHLQPKVRFFVLLIFLSFPLDVCAITI